MRPSIVSCCLSALADPQATLDQLGQLVDGIQGQVDALLAAGDRTAVMPLYAHARAALCCDAARWAYLQWCAVTAAGELWAIKRVHLLHPINGQGAPGAHAATQASCCAM